MSVSLPFSLTCDTESLKKSMLVEASAGTGKTYNIQNLFIRYLVELDIPLENILLVTFTEAAAAELLERIRRILMELSACVENPDFCDLNAQAVQLLMHFDSLNISRKEVSRCVIQALQNFDDAQIFTIHGFCSRVLKDSAFETGALFGAELCTSEETIIHSILLDYFRIHFYNMSPANLEEACESLNLKNIMDTAKKLYLKEDWRVVFNNKTSMVLNFSVPPVLPDGLDFVERESILATYHLVAQLRTKKLSDNYMTFDDLLNIVHRVLCKEGAQNSALLERLRAQCKVMIIDEFQDTDPIQYDIFHVIESPENPLVMVGDPKQSIYAFRNGDIFTYFTAKKDLLARNGAIYSLADNFRSSAPLIDAVNHFWTSVQHPFACEPEQIPFQCVNAGNASLQTPLQHPFGVLYCDTPSIYEVCAQKILEMIQNYNLSPQNFCILTTSWGNAMLACDALRKYNLPVIYKKTPSLFDSAEARDLDNVLQAIWNPGRINLVLNALLTSYCSFRIQDIFRIQNDPKSSEFLEIQARFQTLRDTWIEKGFQAMYVQLIELFDLRTQIAQSPNASRAMTNILQLMELLVSQVKIKDYTPEQLMRVLHDWVTGKALGDKTYEIYLESDAPAIEVTTIFQSKGLEYDYVFLPDLEKLSVRTQSYPETFHRPTESGAFERIFAMKKSDYSAEIHFESFQEFLRLLYVGMTRAKFGCYLCLGRQNVSSKTVKLSVSGWFFSYRDKSASLNVKRENYAHPGQHMSSDEIEAYLEEQGWLVPLPEKLEPYRVPSTSELGVRALPLIHWDHAWKIQSYSYLAPAHFSDSGLNAWALESREESDEPENWGATPLATVDIPPIYRFPSGNKTGLAWHEMMEVFDYTQPLDLDAIRRILNAHGIFTQDTDYPEQVLNMLQTLLHIPLGPERVCLHEIPLAQRITEMEFYLKINTHFSMTRFKDILKRYLRSIQQDERSVDALTESDLRGYMKGLIDLLFEYRQKIYIVDWKSNQLDANPRNFEPEKLVVPIIQNYYYMQYLIYTVALFRYLKHRTRITDNSILYDTYFGGILYIFMRGVTTETSNGVFYQKPDLAIISELEALFI